MSLFIYCKRSSKAPYPFLYYILTDNWPCAKDQCEHTRMSKLNYIIVELTFVVCTSLRTNLFILFHCAKAAMATSDLGLSFTYLSSSVFFNFFPACWFGATFSLDSSSLTVLYKTVNLTKYEIVLVPSPAIWFQTAFFTATGKMGLVNCQWSASDNSSCPSVCWFQGRFWICNPLHVTAIL